MSEDDVYQEEYGEDIYDKKGVDELSEDDEISNSEEAFLKGYDQDINETYNKDVYEDTILCPNCGEGVEKDIVLCPVCNFNIEKAVEF